MMNKMSSFIKESGFSKHKSYQTTNLIFLQVKELQASDFRKHHNEGREKYFYERLRKPVFLYRPIKADFN